jgi:copper chaperone CopZ
LSSVDKVTAEFATKRATITYDPQVIGVEDFVRKIKEIGFGVGTE